MLAGPTGEENTEGLKGCATVCDAVGESSSIASTGDSERESDEETVAGLLSLIMEEALDSGIGTVGPYEDVGTTISLGHMKMLGPLSH